MKFSVLKLACCITYTFDVELSLFISHKTYSRTLRSYVVRLSIHISIKLLRPQITRVNYILARELNVIVTLKLKQPSSPPDVELCVSYDKKFNEQSYWSPYKSATRLRSRRPDLKELLYAYI